MHRLPSVMRTTNVRCSVKRPTIKYVRPGFFFFFYLQNLKGFPFGPWSLVCDSANKKVPVLQRVLIEAVGTIDLVYLCIYKWSGFVLPSWCVQPVTCVKWHCLHVAANDQGCVPYLYIAIPSVDTSYTQKLLFVSACIWWPLTRQNCTSTSPWAQVILFGFVFTKMYIHNC